MRIPMKRRGKPPRRAWWDNQPTTYWHTKWQGDNPQHPHMIVLDLGKVQKLSGFRYLPRQNRENGRIKDYEVYASPKPFKPAK